MCLKVAYVVAHMLLHGLLIKMATVIACINDVIYTYVANVWFFNFKYYLVILGNASITEGMATVTISDLQCGVTYNITAEGVLNETLVGSRSSHGSITPMPCSMISSEYKTIVYAYIP